MVSCRKCKKSLVETGGTYTILEWLCRQYGALVRATAQSRVLIFGEAGKSKSGVPCAQRKIAKEGLGFFRAIASNFLSAFAGLLILGCQQKPAAQAPPPPTVTVAKPVKKEIVEWQYFTAQTQAVDMVSITPRVTGYIDNIPFKEGDIVNVGDLLFLIDPRPYQATLDQAKGQLEADQAQLALNRKNLQRDEQVGPGTFVSAQQIDTDRAQVQIYEGTVLKDQGAVYAAQLNLDFTRVQSPIHGRIGAQLVNRGNLVNANSTQLTTIVSIDPIYANFYVDEASFMQYQESVKAGKLPNAQLGTFPVWLELEAEQGYPHEGVIDFINNVFDPSTSTLQVRGRFPNPNGFLIPGAFGTVRVAGSPKFEGILVADRAIGSDQNQKYVVIVQPDGLTKYQTVELGPIVDGLRVVRSGLTGDETIVVDGIGKVRPNSKVNAEPTDMNKYATEQLAMETPIGQEQVSSTATRLSSPMSVRLSSPMSSPTNLSVDRSQAQSVSEVGRMETKVPRAMGATKPTSEH
ncbi:MAG TPA: efflux RND transporter periplasmic adaptor subunit [Chthoniobacterales bacterium]|nr:efflux RND transporter periplasmic adaptor subunit [Chthoniobacterales bacterium]